MLISVLKNHKITEAFTHQEWQLLLSEARAANLIGRVAYVLLNQNDVEIPKSVALHLQSALIISQKQKQQAIHEIREFSKLSTQFDITYLKGVAYIIHDLPISHGRIFSDIDLLLPKASLNSFEIKLLIHGWLKTASDDYDDFYYRQWMHELPPFQHSARETVADVHHNILPLTNESCPLTEDFQYQKIQNFGVDEIKTLSFEDMFIHCSVHLFTESEFHNGLRDLSDLDMLIRHFKNLDADFLLKTISRANELKLSHYLWFSLRYTAKVFDSPITTEELSQLTIKEKSQLQKTVNDFCFKNIFTPDHNNHQNWKRTLASFFLYWRGHLLRMPLKLLLPHLSRKTWKQLKESFTKEDISEQKLN
ncbi:nucleotidyltransferase family protein [Colwelliaceae bacterium 6441]